MEKDKKDSGRADSVAAWIPVSERLPEENAYVLGFDKENNDILVLKYSIGIWFPTEFPERNVTHWMPLPDLPQEPDSPTNSK